MGILLMWLSRVNAWAGTAGARPLNGELLAPAVHKGFIEALGPEVSVPSPGERFVLLFEPREGKQFLRFVAVARILLDAEIVIPPVVRSEYNLAPYYWRISKSISGSRMASPFCLP
jgi:hypothetical protein